MENKKFKKKLKRKEKLKKRASKARFNLTDYIAKKHGLVKSPLKDQGNRKFLSQEPIPDGIPQIEVRFAKRRAGKYLKLFVPLNFDLGDPAQVFTRVR